jgi:hypothetical protein
MVDRQAVLALVNRVRVEIGLPALVALPKGTRAAADACPLARALNYDGKVRTRTAEFNVRRHNRAAARVCGTKTARAEHVWKARPDTAFELPELLRTFVQEFDNGQHPDLIESK